MKQYLKGETVFLVEAGDYEAYKERLFQLVNNKSLREQMGKEFRQIAEEKYGLKKWLIGFLQ
jgi:glycosyltransferase involved in cell wall biosynthesis